MQILLANPRGISAGAATPEFLVERVVDRIRSQTGAQIGQLAGVEEAVQFPLPRELA